MRAQALLQILYSFFLGLVVVAFVGVGLNTFYPAPKYTEGPAHEAAMASWSLTTSILLVVLATLCLLVSFIGSEKQAVIANGLLMGGLFTMIYGVGMSIASQSSLLRFFVITAALAVTVAIGWLKFSRRKTPRTAGAGEAAAGEQIAVSAEVEARLAAVEAKLGAIGRALHG